MFITTPVYLFIMPYILYCYRSYQEFIYGTAMIILIYLMILEEFMFVKSIVRKIQLMEAEEVNSISPDISPGQ